MQRWHIALAWLVLPATRPCLPTTQSPPLRARAAAWRVFVVQQASAQRVSLGWCSSRRTLPCCCAVASRQHATDYPLDPYRNPLHSHAASSATPLHPHHATLPAYAYHFLPYPHAPSHPLTPRIHCSAGFLTCFPNSSPAHLPRATLHSLPYPRVPWRGQLPRSDGYLSIVDYVPG